MASSKGNVRPMPTIREGDIPILDMQLRYEVDTIQERDPHLASKLSQDASAIVQGYKRGPLTSSHFPPSVPRAVAGSYGYSYGRSSLRRFSATSPSQDFGLYHGGLSHYRRHHNTISTPPSHHPAHYDHVEHGQMDFERRAYSPYHREGHFTESHASSLPVCATSFILVSVADIS